ncbi:MAG: type 1 glutamine amidotransferase [Rhodospirillaceae bacterium]|nr:type 1 glutamine amidotransferase [Rhodospirillaceae bacterium]MBT3926925.1 type 1 glutamine amidotransferase [Rhodospirillaceae bacterium]MBT5778041.1 type 1 glutamine amidotransferase [Rhodospirillaceae bacterium]
MKVLVLQSHLSSGPAYLDEPAARHDAVLEACMPHLEADAKLPEDDSGYDAFMLLGGIMNAGDVAEYPWLEQAAELVRMFTAKEKPVIGICLGAQIIARAFGAKTYFMPASEIGFIQAHLTNAARDDALLGREFADPLYLAEFHSQTFDIPDSGTLLIEGKECRNQAFRIGAATYAFQAHFEVTPASMTQWVEGSDELVSKFVPDLPQQLPHLLNLYHYGSHDFCWKVGSAWFDLIAERMKRA